MTGQINVNKIAARTGTSITVADGHKITGAAGSVTVPGQIIQIVNNTSTSQLTTSSTSFVITDITVNITPTSSSNKILVIATCPVYATGNHQIATIYRDSTNIGGASWGIGAGTTNIICNPSGGILDSPNTTSQITYAVYTRNNGGSASYAMINSAMGTITAMEIAQ